jgi:hypothetical protein
LYHGDTEKLIIGGSCADELKLLKKKEEDTVGRNRRGAEKGRSLK